MEQQDHKETLEQMELTAQLVNKEPQELMELMEQQDHKEIPVLLINQVLIGLLELVRLIISGALLPMVMDYGLLLLILVQEIEL